jgi:hypothetical protein
VDIAGSEAIGPAARQPLSTWDAGTGQFALPAALRFGQVIAVNVSPAMLGALAATGFEVTDVSFGRRLYGAYTCVKVG